MSPMALRRARIEEARRVNRGAPLRTARENPCDQLVAFDAAHDTSVRRVVERAEERSVRAASYG